MGTMPASFLLPHAVSFYPPRHFALSPTPFCLIPHTILPYPQRHFALSATPFRLIRHAILPYPPRLFCLTPRHLALSPSPFSLIRHAILPYPPRHFCLISNTILPYPPRRFSLPLPLITDYNCCKLGMMGINSNKGGGFLQPSSPPLTTANTLVLRTLAPRKPIFMQQMR